MDLKSLGWDAALAAAFAPFSAAGLVPARVTCEHKHACTVLAEASELSGSCTGRLLREAVGRSDLPTVGDWVAISQRPGEAVADIHAVLPRRTRVARRVAGTRHDEQVLAANVDTLLVVEPLDTAHNLPRLSRFLAAAHESGATPVVVLTKTDLHPDPVEALAEVREQAPGIHVLAVCAPARDGIAALDAYLTPGCTLALLGPSGVGKSTLINTLLGVDLLDTGARRETDGRGRHTTSRRELVVAPSGALLIDTPGLRELQFHAYAQPELDDTFADVASLAGQCRFRDCSHRSEPGCAVLEALADGTLSEERWASFQKLDRERAWLERRDNRVLEAATRAAWKRRHVAARAKRRFDDAG